MNIQTKVHLERKLSSVSINGISRHRVPTVHVFAEGLPYTMFNYVTRLCLLGVCVWLAPACLCRRRCLSMGEGAAWPSEALQKQVQLIQCPRSLSDIFMNETTKYVSVDKCDLAFSYVLIDKSVKKRGLDGWKLFGSLAFLFWCFWGLSIISDQL